MDIKGFGAEASYETQIEDRDTGQTNTPPPKKKSEAPLLSNLRDQESKAREPQKSLFLKLPIDVMRYFASFVGKDEFERLAATCFELRSVFYPYKQYFTGPDRSAKVESLSEFKMLLDYAATGPELITSGGTLQPFRCEMLTALGSRILALPGGDRTEACAAFVSAAKLFDGETTSSLKDAIAAAEQGVARLESVERLAVVPLLVECLGCVNPKAVRHLAARSGVCSQEALAQMQWQAALGAMRRRQMSAEEACALFGISGAENQAQLQKEHDGYVQSQCWAVHWD